MKKALLFLFLAAFSTASAQIVINDTDFPTAGTSFWMADDNTVPAGLDLGTASSTPQTWDFSMLMTDTLYAVNFYDPATVDPNGDFPNANLAMNQFGGIGFAEFGSTDVQIIGIAADFGAALGLPVSFEATVAAEDPLKIFEFPSSNGTSYTDTAIFEFTLDATGLLPAIVTLLWNPDSIRVKRTMHSYANIDAEGVLTDVMANDHNVLRQYIAETSIDSVWGLVSGVWSDAPSFPGMFDNPRVSMDTMYRFIGQEVGYIVAEIAVDGLGNPIDATFLSDPSQCCTGIEEIIASGQNVIYPNPANDYIQVRTGGDIYRMELIDMSGKILQTTLITHDGQSVYLDGLADGLYIYRLLEENGRIAHTGRLSRIR